MVILISWSGEISGKLAQILKSWLTEMLPSLEDCWLSSDNIPPGTRWRDQLRNALHRSNYAIVCLTKDNISSPWLNFESGAIAESLETNRVCPLLFGVDTSELRDHPLSIFQAVSWSKKGLQRLVEVLNNGTEHALTPSAIRRRLDNRWRSINEKVERLMLEVGHDHRIKYLKGSTLVYSEAVKAIRYAETRIQILQFYPGPRLPIEYVEAIARILRYKYDQGKPVYFDAYLIVSPDRMPENLTEMNNQRLAIYERHGVAEFVRPHVLKMNYPESFGLDLFIVDKKYAHLSFNTVDRVPDLQRAIAFADKSDTVADLFDWLQMTVKQEIERNR